MKIKGVNFGGWLLMEGYILQARNRAEHILKREFVEKCGKNALPEFEKAFRDNFITEQDFKNVAAMGANTIRLPFNCRLIEKTPYKYSDEGFAYLEKALNLAKKYGLKIILDLHAAPGSQNHDWHSDSDGRAMLWKSSENRKRTYKLWDALSNEFSSHDALLGYDVLNEAVVKNNELPLLKEFYSQCIKAIRNNDKTRRIYLEGNIWAQQIDFLAPLINDGIGISVHTYEPLHFTFSFNKLLSYPGKIDEGFAQGYWDLNRMYKYLKHYRDFAKKYRTDIFVGEFGINWRGGKYGEHKWLDDILTVFDDYGFGYTYWTYKCFANHMFPDGIYQYLPFDDFSFRSSDEPGWESYKYRWKSRRKELINAWSTKNFTPAKQLVSVLSKHFKSGS